MNRPIETEVLIVGGGPVGLTASILLSREGVRSLLVERHPGTATHPKARAINARSMELYRQCGVEAAIREAGLGPEHTGLIIWTRTLSGDEIERRVPWRAGGQSLAASPVRNCLCAQDDLEPVLRTCAEQQGPGELRFDAELTACKQDRAGVAATLTDRFGGGQTHVRAQYVIAADGAQSSIRRQLGVRMIGLEMVYESVNILVKADLRPWTAHRPAALYFIEHPKIKATFLTINAVDRWGFLVNNLSAYGYKASDFTPERSAELVRMAVGAPNLEVKILRNRTMECLGPRSRAIPPRPHLSCRGRSPRNAADRGFWPEHGRPGRSQSRVEAGGCPPRCGWAIPIRDIQRRAPARRPRNH